MAGIVAPKSFPVRHPTDPKQTNGRVLNPVRYMKLGGLSGPGAWPKEEGVPGVERATDVKAAHKSSKNSD